MLAKVRASEDRAAAAASHRDEIPTFADILWTTILVAALPLLVLRAFVWALTGA